MSTLTAVLVVIAGVIIVGAPFFFLGKLTKYFQTKICVSCRERVSSKADRCRFCQQVV